MRYLIIGNGVAGINAAKTLADKVKGAEIIIYAAEKHAYYNRWQLPSLLAGEATPQDLYFYPPEWYRERGIQMNVGMPVKALQPQAKRVTLADGAEIAYDRLLLATGGFAAIPPIEGVNKRGVFVLRTMEDALAIRAHADGAKQAVVIGGGLLGLEAARALHALGLPVTVIEFFPRLLPRQLDAPGAEVFQRLIERSGLRVLTGASCERFLGDEAVNGVQLKGGQTLACDLVVVSAGVRSSLQLAKDAGLQVNRGVVVNDRLQTSAPDIYAAGDVAEFNGQVYGIIPAAIEQATVAALNMAGEESIYRGTIPSTTLKVAGIDLTAIGEVNPEGDGFVEQRFADSAQGLYRKFVVRNGRIVGAILIGDKKHVAPITRLIKSATDISAQLEHLTRPEFDPRALFPAQAPIAARYECNVCGYIYDPTKGDPDSGILPGTPFEALPAGWACPACGAAKEMFHRLEN